MRVAALLAIVIGATYLAHEIRDALDLEISPSNEQTVHMAIMVGMAAYIGLLAMPFVPGAEIGLALLTMFGASIAPLVYSATVVAMLLAYGIGRFIPFAALARCLAVLRMRRAEALVVKAAPLSQDDRIALLLDGAPPRVLALALRHRYIALALAVNTPGNAIIGGGGGIMMLAGMSGIFAPLPTALAVMIAVSPVPIAVMVFGV